MKRLPFVAAIGSLLAFSSCQFEHEKNNSHTPSINPFQISTDVMGGMSPDDPQGYRQWRHEMLKNPSTGEIPRGIRAAELAFAARIPARTDRTLNWVQRGPSNMGGRTRALAFDVTDETIMLAGGVTGGIWRTTNGGQSWTKMTDPGQIHSVTSIVQDTRPGHEQTWYAGTGEYYGVVSSTSFSSQFSGNGMMKSTDGGVTWTALPSTQSNTPETLYTSGDMDFIWRVVIDPSDLVNDVVLAAVYDGVMRSDDGGATWTQVLGFGSTTCDNVDLIVTPSGIFYATLSSDGSSKGFYRSDDGINWTNITPSSGMPGSYGRITIAYDPQNENVVWFWGNTPGSGTDSHSVWKYRYLSGDGSGANGVWENRSNNLPQYSCTGFFTFDFGELNTQSSYDVCIAVHPADSNVIYLGGTNVWRTDDQFTTPSSTDWVGGYRCYAPDLSKYVWPNHHPDQHLFLFQPSDPSILYTANDGGVYKSVDNMQDSIDWIPLNNGYITTQFYTVAIEDGDVSTDYLIGGMQDNGTRFTNTIELDSPWVEILRGDGSFCAIPEGRNHYVTSLQLGKVYVSTVDNDGNVLSFERIDPTGGPNNYNFINPLHLDPNNPNRLYFPARVKIWRQDSLDAIPQTNNIYNTISMGWTDIQESYVGISGGYTTCIDMCKTAPNTLWYGTSIGKIWRLDSADSAVPVQTDIRGSNFPNNAYMSCVAVNPFNQDEIMVTFSNYGIPSIFYTNDGGQTWEDVGGNLEENLDGSGSGPAVYCAYIYPDGTKFVGTSTGLYSTETLDSANTVWAMEGPTTIGNVVINMIEVRTFDGRIVIGTHGNGVYEASLPPTFVGIEEGSSTNLSLFPNPASDNVTIEWPSSFKPEVIKVYDLGGRVVNKTDVNGLNGNPINISNLATGIYIISVESKQKKVTRKFIKR